MIHDEAQDKSRDQITQSFTGHAKQYQNLSRISAITIFVKITLAAILEMGWRRLRGDDADNLVGYDIIQLRDNGRLEHSIHSLRKDVLITRQICQN